MLKVQEVIPLEPSTKATRVTQDQIQSMEIEKNIGNVSSFSYDAEDYSHQNWVFHLTYEMLRTIPKFIDNVGDDSETLHRSEK